MKYEEMVKIVANGQRTAFERGDVIIREMCGLIDSILDYRYAGEHYNGDGTALEDKKNLIKKNLVLVTTDLDIYMEQLGITEEVKNKATKRLEKIAKRV